MSTLWTPSGEHQPEEPVDEFADEDLADDLAAYGQPYEGAPSTEEVEEMWRARAELAGVAVTDIVANHAVGLWQLAVIHLMPDPDPEGLPTEPRLDEGPLACHARRALARGPGPPPARPP